MRNLFCRLAVVARGVSRQPALIAFTALAALGTGRGFAAPAPQVDHVIHVSVDGLRPDAITFLGPTNLPNFYRLRTEGAFTDNARSDYDYTDTLPNHCTQLTGRAVLGTAGHGWINNTDPPVGATLASNRGFYIAGVFDMAHDNGLRTGEYASKSKFSLFDTSWNATNGALDAVPPDNGRDKVDVYANMTDTAALANQLVADMSAQPLHYAFIHFTDPDTTGHVSGWVVTNGSAYCNTIKTIDGRLGVIFSLVTTNVQLAGRTAIVLTADHGGTGTGHGTASVAANYTVPFYVWGPGVMAGAPLYKLNPTNRLDPATGQPTYAASLQPIRNGEAANVSLKLLGLPPVTGSTIAIAQDLALTVPPPADFCLISPTGPAVFTFSTKTNVLYDLQFREDLGSGWWVNLATNIAGTGDRVTRTDPAASGLTQRFYRVRLHF
jgi:hypothetical protein